MEKKLITSEGLLDRVLFWYVHRGFIKDFKQLVKWTSDF